MKITARGLFFARVVLLLYQKQKMSGCTVSKAAQGARHLSLSVKLANPLELDKAIKLAEPLALACNCPGILAQRQAGVVAYQFELSQALWQSYTRAELPTPESVGLAEDRQPVKFDFSQPHCLVAGTTGSGKSEAIKSILLSLMTTYSPDELRIILVDPHNDFDDFKNEAHIITLATGPEAIAQALAYVNQELAHRKAENIKDGHLLVLCLDEGGDALPTDAKKEVIRQVAQEGRKYKVHLVLGHPEPSQKTLPGTLNLLLNKFVGLVEKASTSSHLTGRSGLNAHLLTGEGDFIHISARETVRFQVAMATRRDFDSLERIERAPVEVTPDLVEIPTAPAAALPERQPGRPRLQVQPEIAAQYFWYSPGKISISMAKEMWGLSRDAHNLHKNFAVSFVNQIHRLRGITA